MVRSGWLVMYLVMAIATLAGWSTESWEYWHGVEWVERGNDLP